MFCCYRLYRGSYNLVSIMWFTNRTAFSRSIVSRQNGALPVSDVKDGRCGSLTALTVAITNAKVRNRHETVSRPAATQGQLVGGRWHLYRPPSTFVRRIVSERPTSTSAARSASGWSRRPRSCGVAEGKPAGRRSAGGCGGRRNRRGIV
jgi:hypothetical protein